MTPEQIEATVAMNQQALPWTQLAQQAGQWSQELAENQRRFWEAQWPWQQTTDQFAMDLARQQQAWQEQWLPQQQQAQLDWERQSQASQLAWERERWGGELGLSTRQQQAAEQQWAQEFQQAGQQWGQEYGLRTREQEALERWQDTQAQLQREQMVAEQENAALAAWGRRFRPNTRYL